MYLFVYIFFFYSVFFKTMLRCHTLYVYLRVHIANSIHVMQPFLWSVQWLAKPHFTHGND